MFSGCITTNKKINAILATAGFLFLIFVAAPKAEAATSTIRGVGWMGDTYQNVYFNCLDDVAGDRLDYIGNLYNLPEPRGFHFYVNPCQAGMQHAVYIDSDNNFSGQAWNPTLGFISFAATSTAIRPPSEAPLDNCSSTCNAANKCWACYKESNQKVYGWARIDMSGEWIRLDSSLTPPVSLQSCDLTNSVFPGHGVQSGEFVGYADHYSGNVSFTETLSFNCESELDKNACAIRNYKVYISNLTLGKLTAPNWTYAQACSNALGATLRWCKKSGTQTAYEIMVNTSNTPNPATAVCWSGKKYSDFATQYNFPNSDCASLNYNTNYYWWVRAYDEKDVATDWYQYNANSVSDTDGNPDNNTLTFTTFKHNFPSPYFTWDPYEPIVGTSTLFSAITSRYYTTAQPTLAQSCAGSNCRYSWGVTNGTYTISSSTAATTTIVFTNSVKGAVVSLGLRDVDNYMCSSSTAPMEINYDLPLWLEVKAK